MAWPGGHERLAGLALAALAAGRIRPVIGQVFPLPQAAEAQLAPETRSAAGKTLLTVA
jgi:NADPH2:quinone reductase